MPSNELSETNTLLEVYAVSRNTINSQMSQPCFLGLNQAPFECSLFPSFLQSFGQFKDHYEVWDSAL